MPLFSKVLKTGPVIEPFKLPVRGFIGSTGPTGGTRVQNPSLPFWRIFILGREPAGFRFGPTGFRPVHRTILAFSRAVSNAEPDRDSGRFTVRPAGPIETINGIFRNSTITYQKGSTESSWATTSSSREGARHPSLAAHRGWGLRNCSDIRSSGFLVQTYHHQLGKNVEMEGPPKSENTHVATDA
ncbi:hypothetical protein PIB30_023551 [Stylosanthes scabra]|uniref:Uncharacterized protein n=1 Tax=Stylosanthes scabra TaxID=79078 RepID=A0ABU6W7R3_9FABA|nr:hypothetical protein [Stylosanthes scabra]